MSSKKRKLFEDLVDEVRRSQSATDRYDQAVADSIGLNRTDMRCLDTIQREGTVSAGRLAAVTGLTSGAMTAAVDRLERRGFARRVADPADRRRVLVELDPAIAGVAERLLRRARGEGRAALPRYSEAELELLLEFVREGRELNESEAEKLEQRNRSEAAG